MCRFQCKDPETCKIPRFTIDLVKDEVGHGNYGGNYLAPPPTIKVPSPPTPGFVRNQKVQFFSPPSDSEGSDDEEDFYDAMPLRRNLLSPGRLSSSGPMPIVGNGNVGVCAAAAASVDEDDNDPSYLMTSTSASSSDSGFSEMASELEGKEESDTVSLKSILRNGNTIEKKQVRFADDCGHTLIHCRSIQSRLIDALFADLVEIEPVEEAAPSAWRVALLRKLFATPFTNTTSLLSLGEDELEGEEQQMGNAMPEPVQA